MSDKNIYQKNKYFFASFNNDQGLRLDDKTKGLCRQKYRRSSKFVTWGHTTRVIFRVKTCIFEWSNEKTHFSKTKIYFHNKEKVCRTKIYIFLTMGNKTTHFTFLFEVHSWFSIIFLSNKNETLLLRWAIKLCILCEVRRWFPTIFLSNLITKHENSWCLFARWKTSSLWAKDRCNR